MAGEHILELLLNENERVSIGDRWLVCNQAATRIQNITINRHPVTYCVYERKSYQKKTRILIETEDEELACRVLKGE